MFVILFIFCSSWKIAFGLEAFESLDIFDDEEGGEEIELFTEFVAFVSFFFVVVMVEEEGEVLDVLLALFDLEVLFAKLAKACKTEVGSLLMDELVEPPSFVVEVEVETEHNCTGVMVGDLGGSR